MQDKKHIILYDGECGLCSRSVVFIRKRDKKNLFQYVPLQSSEAIEITGSENIMEINPETVIYVRDGRFYYRSEASIRIMMALGGFYSLFAVFLIIPRKIRDYFYNLIARNRHRWFKSDEACTIDP